MAGWFGSPRQWRKFHDEWDSILKEFRVPEFHSKDFFHRDHNTSPTNPYRGWSPETAERFTNELTRAIAVRELHPIGAAIDVQVFMSYSVGERRFLTHGGVKPSGRITGPNMGTPGKPYHTAMFLCIGEAVMAAQPPTQVYFVFDQNDQESKYVRRVFASMKTRQTMPDWERLGELIFASRVKEPGLQAADLYSHLWGAFLENGTDGMGKERNRVFQQMKKRRDWIRVYDEAAFEAALDSQLTPGQRQRLREGTSW
jgi:hypothetical protein